MKDKIASIATVLIQLSLFVCHIWALVLSVQVNGFANVRGIISFCLTFIPVVGEVYWGVWAYGHNHPFFYVVTVTGTVFVIGGFIIPFMDSPPPKADYE